MKIKYASLLTASVLPGACTEVLDENKILLSSVWAMNSSRNLDLGPFLIKDKVCPIVVDLKLKTHVLVGLSLVSCTSFLNKATQLHSVN